MNDNNGYKEQYCEKSALNYNHQLWNPFSHEWFRKERPVNITRFWSWLSNPMGRIYWLLQMERSCSSITRLEEHERSSRLLEHWTRMSVIRMPFISLHKEKSKMLKRRMGYSYKHFLLMREITTYFSCQWSLWLLQSHILLNVLQLLSVVIYKIIFLSKKTKTITMLILLLSRIRT